MCLTLQLCFAQCLESSKCPMNVYQWKNKCMEWTSWRNRKRRRWERRSISNVSSSRLLLFSPSVVWLFVTPWTAARRASLSFTISQSMLKLMCFESVSNHLILCQPLLLLSSIFPRISIFSNESTLLLRLPKYWSFSFSINPSSEYSGLISFKMDWFYLYAVQGTLKSLFQHRSLKASILWGSSFFMVQLSYQYMTTGKP